MNKPENPKKLMCQAGPFTADEWKEYMESYKKTKFNKLKCTKKTLIRVFNLYLFERGLFIERFGKLYTYKLYLDWIRENLYAPNRYKEYSNEYINWDENRTVIMGRWTKERCLKMMTEEKAIIDRGGETEDLYIDQYKLWRKSWVVDESRFYKDEK
jgi:hypothetical protein